MLQEQEISIVSSSFSSMDDGKNQGVETN